MLELGIDQVGIFFKASSQGGTKRRKLSVWEGGGGGGKPPAKVKKYIVNFKSHQIAT